MSKLRELVEQVLAKDLTAILPLVDYLKEQKDLRWRTILHTFGQFAQTCQSAETRQQRLEIENASPEWIGEAKYRGVRNVWERMCGNIRRDFWQELSDKDLIATIHDTMEIQKKADEAHDAFLVWESQQPQVIDEYADEPDNFTQPILGEEQV